MAAVENGPQALYVTKREVKVVPPRNQTNYVTNGNDNNTIQHPIKAKVVGELKADHGGPFTGSLPPGYTTAGDNDNSGNQAITKSDMNMNGTHATPTMTEEVSAVLRNDAPARQEDNELECSDAELLGESVSSGSHTADEGPIAISEDADTDYIEDVSVSDDGLNGQDAAYEDVAIKTEEPFEAEIEAASEPELVRDPLCKAQETCVANSEDYRKVVSHVFGRNKRATQTLPDDAWILWCRKHYQRFKYRGEDDGTWHIRQLELVRKQLDEFERLSDVVSWEVILNKATQKAIDEDNAKMTAALLAADAEAAAAQKDEDGIPKVTEPDNFVGRPTKVEPSATTNVHSCGDADVREIASITADPATKVSASSKISKSETTSEKEIIDITSSPEPEEVKTLLPDKDASDVSEAILAHATSDPCIDTIEITDVAGSSIAMDVDTDDVTEIPRPVTPIQTPSTPIKIEGPPIKIKTEHTPTKIKLESSRTPSPSPTPSEPLPPIWERFLIPYLGLGKTYADIRAILNLIELEFHTPDFLAQHNLDKEFPGVEFLPHFPNEQPRRAKGGRKKVTEDEKRKKATARARESRRRAREAEGEAEGEGEQGGGKRRKGGRGQVLAAAEGNGERVGAEKDE